MKAKNIKKMMIMMQGMVTYCEIGHAILYLYGEIYVLLRFYVHVCVRVFFS